MQWRIFVIILLLGLFPVSDGFAQNDSSSSLGVGLTSTSPHHYKTDDGRTIVVGEVENTKGFPIHEVKIWAGFFDDTGPSPLESTVGTSLLKVIPPYSKSPYVITSPSPDPEITNVSVNLLGFQSASGVKPQELTISGDTESFQTSDFSYSGSITNTATIASADTRVHLVMHDAFNPPRILNAATVNLGLIPPGDTETFSFTSNHTNRAVGFYVMAESASYLSDMFNVKITLPEPVSKKITISNILVTDSDGAKTSSHPVGSPVLIQSELFLQALQAQTNSQDYTYHIQVKQSGEQAFVEYIGSYDGSFTDSPQNPTVEWIPESAGLYFIETFVWDPNDVPLASKGPVALVLVN